MLTKVVHSNSFDYGGEPTSNVVEATARQIHNGDLAKVAGVEHIFGDQLDGMEVPDNHTVIHIIAVGDGETWGPNRNCDSFSREDNKKTHHLFRDIGHVFRNHKNHSPSLAVGNVLATAHNDLMDRIELMLALDNDKCADEIQQLHEGRDLPTSMGTKQAFDVCSYCEHKAKTAAEHCSHVKYHLGEVADNGVKVAMLNPNPRYFDISLVFKPADRIAYTLKKIASGNSVLGGHELAEAMGLDCSSSEKTAVLNRLASIQKEVPVYVRQAPEILGSNPKSALKKIARHYGVPALLGYLHKRGNLLCPEDFGTLIVESTEPEKVRAAVEAFDRDIPSLLLDGEHTDCLDGKVEASMPEPSCPGLDAATGMEDPDVRGRMLAIKIEKPVKTASDYTDRAELQGLADLYAQYKVAFALANRDNLHRLRNLALTFPPA